MVFLILFISIISAQENGENFALCKKTSSNGLKMTMIYNNILKKMLLLNF